MNLYPLVVDLDGTLVHSNMLHESTLGVFRNNTLSLLGIPYWLARGKEIIQGRGYVTTDIMRIQIQGITSGYTAVLVQALYLNRTIVIQFGYPFNYLFGGRDFGIFIAHVMGAVLLCTSNMLAIQIFQQSQKDSLKLALLFFIFYIEATAVGTGGGRYTTPTLMAWAVLAMKLGINDQIKILHLYPNSLHAIDIADRASAQNLSIFGQYPFLTIKRELGGPVQYSHLPNCEGSLEGIDLIKDDKRFVRVLG